MRLLLDEMVSATVAEQLRGRGYDVVAMQDATLAHLRGIDDRAVLDHAAESRRAVVTDNVADFVRCHQTRVVAGHVHYGLVVFTNDTFRRHRHDQFVSHIIAALERELDGHPGDDDSSWIRWLAPGG